MAGLNVQSFVSLFAPKGVQPAARSQQVAAVEPSSRFSAYQQGDIKGNPFKPSHSGGSNLPTFGGVNQGCGQGLCLDA